MRIRDIAHIKHWAAYYVIFNCGGGNSKCNDIYLFIVFSIDFLVMWCLLAGQCNSYLQIRGTYIRFDDIQIGKHKVWSIGPRGIIDGDFDPIFQSYFAALFLILGCTYLLPVFEHVFFFAFLWLLQPAVVRNTALMLFFFVSNQS